MRRALLDDSGDGLATSVRARLDRLDKRDHARARELAIVKDTLLLFVRVWFEYAGPLDDSDPDAGADAEVRFQSFMGMLAEQGER